MSMAASKKSGVILAYCKMSPLTASHCDNITAGEILKHCHSKADYDFRVYTTSTPDEPDAKNPISNFWKKAVFKKVFPNHSLHLTDLQLMELCRSLTLEYNNILYLCADNEVRHTQTLFDFYRKTAMKTGTLTAYGTGPKDLMFSGRQTREFAINNQHDRFRASMPSIIRDDDELSRHLFDSIRRVSLENNRKKRSR
jgi:hypothetical protein